MQICHRGASRDAVLVYSPLSARHHERHLHDALVSLTLWCCGPMQVDVSAVGEVDFRSWEGWVHSRARTLVLGMQVCLRRQLPA